MKTTKPKASRTIDPPDLPAATSLKSLNINGFAADSYELTAKLGALRIFGAAF